MLGDLASRASLGRVGRERDAVLTSERAVLTAAELLRLEELTSFRSPEVEEGMEGDVLGRLKEHEGTELCYHGDASL